MRDEGADKKWKNWLMIDTRLPRTSYVLRVFVGFYLFYVDYNIWNGLREEGVHGQPLVILAGVFFILVGIYCIGTGAYALWKKEHKEGTPQEESIGEKKEEEEDRELALKRRLSRFTTSQYVSLIFSRGMYEADSEDAYLFEDEIVRGLYVALYEAVDEEKQRYVYAQNGLWMWKDIVGGVGQVGKTCLRVPSLYYAENYPEIVLSDQYSEIRNAHLTLIGITLLKAHFGRFLYHTFMMLPQAFICTVFFQVGPIYLLCHLVTLFLYLSALALMIREFIDRKADQKCAEFMALILGSNVVMVIVISLVFFGQQRYLVYNFGAFYISYYLLLRELWNGHIRDKARKWRKA